MDDLNNRTNSPKFKDYFGYIDYQKSLFNILADKEPPLTLGIIGDSGTGKSSLMKMMYDELDGNHNEVIQLLPLWVNVSRLNLDSGLWNSFLVHLLQILCNPLDVRPRGYCS